MARRRQRTTEPPPALPPKHAPVPAPDAPAEPGHQGVLLATLIVYALLQILYLTATPLQTITLPDNLPRSGPQSLLVGIGPDEKEHFLYILSLAERGELPAPTPGQRTSPEQYVTYQAQHPPLFYALGAVVYKLTAPLGLPVVWLLLRALCAVCGAVVVVLADRAARLAFPDRVVLTRATAPFVAFLPMFGHMTGNLSNEPLALALGAWAWLQLVRIARANDPPTTRDAVWLGATLGLAALARFTALLWLPAVFVVFAFTSARRQVGRAPFLVSALAFAGIFGLLIAPWLVRNLVLYHTPLLRTFDRPMLAYGSLADFLGPGIVPPNAPLALTPLSTTLWYASTSWFPYWLVQFYLPNFPQAGPAWQALFLLLDVGILLALFLHASRARREGDSDPAGRALLWAAGAAIGFCVLVLLQQQFFADWNVVNSAGRYTVAAVPATALLCLFAVSTLNRRPGGAMRAAVFVTIALLAFDLATVLLVRRFYAEHPAQPTVQPIPAAMLSGTRVSRKQ